MGSVPWVADMVLFICTLTPSSWDEVSADLRQFVQVCCLDTYWHHLLLIDLFVGMEAASKRTEGAEGIIASDQ